MSSRRTVVAAFMIPIILGVSALAIPSLSGSQPLSGQVPPAPPPTPFPVGPCTTTVSLPETAGGVIQNAINAAKSGAVICVSPGVYPEQLTITKPLALKGLGTPQNPAEIKPASVIQTSSDPVTGTPEYNIILVGGGSSSISGVTITGLVVDGSLASSTFTSCADDYEGILFLNAGGAITGDTVQNVYLPSNLAGCQPGLDIEVQTSPGQSSPVAIWNNQVLNYNKNGITCNNAGTNCNIMQNTVSFYTAYAPYIASNGIQVAFGALAQVTQNTVSGNECNLAPGTGVLSGCSSDYVTQYQSAGILTYQSAPGTTVNNNVVENNDVGILASTDSASVTNNHLQNNRYEGLFLNDGTYSTNGNQISGGLVGIAVVSDGNAQAPTAATLNGDNFFGTFGTAPIQIAAYTGGDVGGSYSEPATLTFGSITQTVTPSTCSADTAGGTCQVVPSFVNITSGPGIPQYPPNPPGPPPF